MYFLPEEENEFDENAKVFIINLSDKGYSRLLEAHGIDPKAKFWLEVN